MYSAPLCWHQIFWKRGARFVGQALKPYGREQLVALGLLATTQFVTARIVNAILDDRHDPHWDKPFSIVYKDHEYALRTVPGDIIHLVTDPRSFFYHRMSPILKTAVQGITGRDDRGQKLDAQAQIKDFIESPLPIVFRKKQGDAWWESFMNATGVTEKKYRTKAEEMMRAHFADSLPASPMSDKDKQRYQLRHDLEDKIRAGSNVDDEIAKAIKAGTLKPEDQKEIKTDALSTKLQIQFKKLPIKTALDVFDAMEAGEKKQAEKELVSKYWNALHSRFKGLSAAEAEDVKERIKKLGLIKPSVTTSPSSSSSVEGHLQEL